MSLASLLAAVEARYDIGPIVASRPLEGGEWKTLYRIEAARGAFVVSLTHPLAVTEGVAWEHAFLHHVSSRLPVVPAPIASVAGNTFFMHDGHIVSLLPFMPGEIVDAEHIRLPAAQLLAQFHTVSLAYPGHASRPGIPSLRVWDWHSNHAWHWPDVDALLCSTPDTAPRFWHEGGAYTAQIVARRVQIAEGRAHCERWVAQLASSKRPLAHGVIHDDFYKRNLLVRDGRITALLDWDGCHPDWLMMDLSNAAWAFCDRDDEHTLDVDAARSFVESYLDAGGPIQCSELDLLVPFIRFRRVLETLSGLQNVVNGEQWDEGFGEYELHTLLALENLRDLTLHV